MVKMNDYFKKKQMLDQLTEELKDMESSSELKKEFEFKDKLGKLMEQYGKSGKETLEVLAAIDPSVRTKGAAGGGDSRPKRPLKVYKNPHTGEVVRTRGGNQKTLNEWRKKYGKEKVDSWQES